jgi:hypothetical protein
LLGVRGREFRVDDGDKRQQRQRHETPPRLPSE